MLVETAHHSVFLFQVWSWGGLLCRKFSGPVNRQNKLQKGMRFHTQMSFLHDECTEGIFTLPGYKKSTITLGKWLFHLSTLLRQNTTNSYVAAVVLMAVKSLQTHVQIQLFILICPLEGNTLCMWLTASYILKIIWAHIYSKMTRLTLNAGCNYTKAWRDVSKMLILINSLQNEKL